MTLCSPSKETASRVLRRSSTSSVPSARSFIKSRVSTLNLPLCPTASCASSQVIFSLMEARTQLSSLKCFISSQVAQLHTTASTICSDSTTADLIDSLCQVVTTNYSHYCLYPDTRGANFTEYQW